MNDFLEDKLNKPEENEPNKPTIKEMIWESVETPAYIGLGTIALYLTHRIFNPSLSSVVTPFDDLLLASGFHAGYVSKHGKRGSMVAIAASFYPEAATIIQDGDLERAGLQTGFKLFLGLIAYTIGRMYPFFGSKNYSDTI